MSRPTVRLAAAMVAATALALGTLGAASAAPDGVKPLPHAQAVETRSLAQQGLAIALANGVLQGNLVLSEFGYPGETGVKTGQCYDFDAGIGVVVRKLAQPSKTRTVITDQLYYDAKCTKPYIEQVATLTSSNGGNSLAASETWTYRALTGRTLGRFTARAAVDDTAQGLKLHGIGTYRPTGSTSPVSLGLTCTTAPEADGATSSTWHCAGGIAQRFAGLGVSLGSVTPLTLIVQNGDDNSGGFGRVDFSGSKAGLRSSSGKLGVALTASNTLKLTGAGHAVGTVSTKGTAAQFALFTPRPTGWTITDKTSHTAFSIAVTGASLKLAGTVIDTRTKSVLAKLAVDRSGTGTITYRGAKPVEVRSWLLAS